MLTNPDDTLPAALYAILTERHAERTVAELATLTGRDEAEVGVAMATLVAEGKAFGVTPGGFLSDVAWKRVTETARRILTTFHKRNPYKRRAPDSELRPLLAKAATVLGYLGLKAVLERAGVWVRESGGARLPDFVIVLPPHWEDAAREMMTVFVAGGLVDPPWPGNFKANYPRDVSVDGILDALRERGELVRLADDLFIARETWDAAKDAIRAIAASGMPITIGAVRDATGSSRRVVVPLLEMMDSQGFTRRNDEARTIAPPKTGTPPESPDH